MLLEGDVRSIGKKELRKVVERGPHVKLWIVGGGFPCQPHSRLNSQRTGFNDPRSFHQEIPRLVHALRDVLADHSIQIAVFGERVASMDDDTCRNISRDLGVKPLGISPSTRVPMRRPRLYWINWQIQPAQGYSRKPGPIRDQPQFHTAAAVPEKNLD